MSETAPAPRRLATAWQRMLPWAITILCFLFLYRRIDAAAARQGSALVPYLAGVFSRVSWPHWLALMIPYSAFYFAIDSAVVWRVVSWFNAPVRYRDILPVRASTYILSILNEQVGKGAMALYLHRREGVPGWQLGSSMLFVMFCEFYYLLIWAGIGAALRWDEVPAAFHILPALEAAAFAFFAVHFLYFRGVLLPGVRLRDRPLLDAFRQATLRHYVTIVLLRSPALLSGVLVYTLALRLFGVEAGFSQMLSLLPLVFFGAAVPGPLRAVAISMWVLLFPDHPAEMAAFGLVMHNFFIFFNATIGLLFLRRANREIFGEAASSAVAEKQGSA